MSERDIESAVERRARDAARRAALQGAFLASAVIVAVAAARDLLDGWLLGGAVVAVALSAVAIAGRDRGRRVRAEARRPAPSRGVADALLANVPDPVILVDRRTIVVEANAAAKALLPGLRLRHPLSFALRSPDVLDGIDRVLRTGESLRVELVERIPTERAFEVLIGALNADTTDLDREFGVMLFFRDLTSARRLEAMRVDFVANASHELRTPLASLLGFIETLQGPARNDPPARERFLDIMRGQAQRMTRLIDDLLSLSRIEMRAHLAPEAVVDLRSIVAQMVDTLSALARERGVDIKVELPGEALLVRGDRDELLRVVENLVENAVKYGESGGRVDVALARTAGNLVEFSVRDYGPGIAAEHLPRLTERFYRVDVAQSREKGGTGLGLAIVKHIVNRHRGHLTIDSKPGEGASFKVMLPGWPGPETPAE
ncbi:MAG TPA: ATP-binding protein [Microvirga sp.]|jgi:two-component system, OmpR family, phosphate regulon sensor histidine kinase PhoR|nr:ATP-binding protein [Microvirga sp.]